jgi:hypothetical protein
LVTVRAIHRKVAPGTIHELRSRVIARGVSWRLRRCPHAPEQTVGAPQFQLMI